MALPNINAALYTTLTGNGAVSAIVSTKVYNLKNEAQTAVPYIVFYMAASNVMNINPSQLHSYLYRVDCWQTSAKLARTLASAVFDALHLQTLTVSGNTNYWTAVESELAMSETQDNTEYYRHILNVRIKTTNG